jgi:uncharacterized protein (DUF169 family)
MGLRERIKRLEALLRLKAKPVAFNVVLEDDAPGLEEDGNEHKETNREVRKSSQT